jgi:hypothetical protein
MAAQDNAVQVLKAKVKVTLDKISQTVYQQKMTDGNRRPWVEIDEAVKKLRAELGI